jgi:hypothetical protein
MMRLFTPLLNRCSFFAAAATGVLRSLFSRAKYSARFVSASAFLVRALPGFIFIFVASSSTVFFFTFELRNCVDFTSGQER